MEIRKDATVRIDFQMPLAKSERPNPDRAIACTVVAVHGSCLEVLDGKKKRFFPMKERALEFWQ